MYICVLQTNFKYKTTGCLDLFKYTSFTTCHTRTRLWELEFSSRFLCYFIILLFEADYYNNTRILE